MHQLQKIIQGALASVTITIFSLTSAVDFAQAGHYFNDNKHVTVDCAGPMCALSPCALFE